MEILKLGSLFDGSGTAPLAAAMCGVEPVWASEIEPYPIAVTRSRFPRMKHLGSITEINGAEIEPVDILVGGSPCQDLSVAGARKGLHEGERSHLFYEMIRIIKEMREATNGRYPAFAVWENVPGAFSSNKGEDFRCVIEEFCKVKDPDVSIPRPADGKWLNAGEIVGEGYSIAWRQLDAQYWGVPQRRKRIYLVADFDSERVGKILFERESVRWNPSESGEAREGAAADVEGIAGGSGCIWLSSKQQSPAVSEGIGNTLGSNNYKEPQGVCYAIDSLSSNSMKSGNPNSGFHKESISKTLQAFGQDPSCNQGGNVIVQNVDKLNRKYIVRRLTPTECARLQGFPDCWGYPDRKDTLTDEEAEFWEGVRKTYAEINGKAYKPMKTRESLLKWYNGLHTDSAEYKMWGNGMALPNMLFVIERMSAELEQVKRERDAAITHMEYIVYGDNPCMYCKKDHNCDGGSLHGTADDKCSVFEWRGVCAKNSGGDEE